MTRDTLTVDITPHPDGGLLLSIHDPAPDRDRLNALPSVHARGPLGIATALDVLRRRARAAGLLGGRTEPADTLELVADQLDVDALTPAARAQLRKALGYRLQPDGRLRSPGGHSYTPGTRQADAVRKVLAEHGIDPIPL